MRLALADVKKTIHRRDGTVYVAPYLMRPRERERELATLIALFEGALDRPRSAFSADLAAEIIGDYRLARCLVLCLSEWYAWQTREWATSVTSEEIAALSERGIANPTQLRLALYDAARERGGYLAEDEREQALAAIARNVGVTLPALERLLYLDAEENATLRRVSAEAPTAGELRAIYNQRAFEALLSSAASVELLIPPASEAAEEAGRGALVKRICFLAKRLGVQYDLAFEGRGSDTTDGDIEDLRRVAEAPAAYTTSAPRPLDDVADRALVVMLFGPQELVGSPAQYGERLAAVCRALLGYRASESTPAQQMSSGLHGSARIYLHGRPLVFSLDDRVLRLVRRGKHEPSPGKENGPSFDSELERRLHEEFAAYELSGEAHGWRLEREPEPIFVDDMIMIPDFALTRGGRRVYLEIAGYWRPEYRERKLRKLRALRGAVSLIVAAPESARAEYEALAKDFPLLWYRAYLGARPLLDLLDRSFDDLDRRLASVDYPGLLNTVTERQVIPEQEALALLRVYSRNERAAAMARLNETAPVSGQLSPEWLDGVGLCAGPLIEAVISWSRERVAGAEGAQLALPALEDELRHAFPLLAAMETAGTESLARRAGLFLARSSLFEAIVTLDGRLVGAESPMETPLSTQSAQPRRGVRRKHHRDVYATPSLFAPENAISDSSPPVAPRPKIP